MEIVLASRNQGKIKELSELVSDLDIQALSLDDLQLNKEIPEKYDTYVENALVKAKEVSLFSNKIAIADDSGIEIAHYDDGPGVKSARFLSGLTYEQKNLKIIKDLKNVGASRRGVKYKCCIAIYKPGGKSFTCMGECEGLIAEELKGSNGFGYDPIFFLPKYGKTFAEISIEIKNRISHRGIAFRKAKEFLKNMVTVHGD